MYTWIYRHRWLWILFTLLLLLYNSSLGTVRLQSSTHIICHSKQAFLAPNDIPDDVQMISCRFHGTQAEFVHDTRHQTIRYHTSRLEGYFILYLYFLLLTFLFRRFLSVYARNLRNILPKALQLVRFLHRTDGKISSFYHSYEA